MRQVITAILILSVATNALAQKKSSEYINENFVFFGAKAMRVNGAVYRREITAKDFKTNDNSIVEGFALGDEMYIDNGENNDKKANDGIYTSVDTYQIKNEINDTITLSDILVFGTNFKFEKELERYLSENRLNEKTVVKYKCDISSCTCAECSCIACNNHWEQNSNWCFNANNCGVVIGFDF